MDPFRLNEHTLFRDLKDNLPKTKDMRNILAIRDNNLYVWNANDFCVMTSYIISPEEDNEKFPYQKLRPTDPPVFDVQHLLINEVGTLLVLWSNMGMVIMNLPKRWRNGMFQGGKEEILCKSYTETVEIRKARWHPGSTNGSHLLVLTTENVFRLYECELDNKPRKKRRWIAGQQPQKFPTKIPNFMSLGDVAVDFDFVTPTVSSLIEDHHRITWDQIDWYILVLRENGEVFITYGNILSDRFLSYGTPFVSEPLTINPQTSDNYGMDSCSILCIQTTPPIVVIATRSGKFYHAILLKEAEPKPELDNSINDKKSNSSYDGCAMKALYVYETVEVELGLFFTDDDEKSSSPIFLWADDSNKSRYFCSHNAGIHMTSLPMVFELEKYLDSLHETCDASLPRLSNKSTSQYLICRRTKYTKPDKPTPILGYGLIQEPCTLIALLNTGDVVARSVIDLLYCSRIETPVFDTDQKEHVNREDFDVRIKKLLKHEISQPLIKIGTTCVSPRECLQLLYHATHIFRQEIFVRHDTVREEIGKKVRALRLMETHLLKELFTLLETKKELHQTAEKLAERYEDTKDKQEELVQRVKKVLQLVHYKKPTMTPVEREEAHELRKVEISVKEMDAKLLHLRKKCEEQSYSIEDSKSNKNENTIVFKKEQERTIKNHLAHMSKDIEVLVSSLKTLEEETTI